jgi:hypothetical protein
MNNYLRYRNRKQLITFVVPDDVFKQFKSFCKKENRSQASLLRGFVNQCINHTNGMFVEMYKGDEITSIPFMPDDREFSISLLQTAFTRGFTPIGIIYSRHKQNAKIFNQQTIEELFSYAQKKTKSRAIEN